MRPLLFALALLALPVQAGEAPGHGLMWHRTGLPLSFPLTLRTDPGRSYHLLLRDAETGAEALAAFVEGGRFFRVLAPPGTYRVTISHGREWISEAQLFGERTGVIEVKEPLTFEVRGLARKAGYVVDLRGLL